MSVSACRLQGTYADEGLRFKMIGEAGRFDELAGLLGVLEFINMGDVMDRPCFRSCSLWRHMRSSVLM